MNFKEELKKYQNYIDEKLDEYFKDDNTYEKRLRESMRYSLLAGGKRIRPILMLATYRLFKEDFERGLITNDSLQTSIELGNFNDDGTGHYKAVFGHDDLVMTMVQLTFVKNTLQYKMMKSDFDSQIEPQQSQQDSNYDVYAEPWGEDIYDLDVKGNVGRLNRFINQL